MTESRNKACYPWLETQWRELNTAIEQGRLPHAILLVGPEGIGKRALAAQLVSTLLCESGNACKKCNACKKLSHNAHPDSSMLMPEEGKRDISIEFVRNSLEFLRLSPQISKGWKILTVDPADRMTREAANAFLKTLEEPPEKRLILLIAEQLHRVPVTIRSRCRQLRFHAVTPEQSRIWLESEGLKPAESMMQQHDYAPLLIKSEMESGDSEGSISTQQIKMQFRSCLGQAQQRIMVAEEWSDIRVSQAATRLIQSELLQAMRALQGIPVDAADNVFLRENINLDGLLNIGININKLAPLFNTTVNRKLLWGNFLLECHRIKGESIQTA